ncbi:unnamed protein product [Alopecurus aequalis]
MKKKAAAATLSEDVVLEILVRITDATTLLRCTTACKRWRALIVDPSFAPDRSFLLGLFSEHWRYGQRKLGTIHVPMLGAFFPVPWLPFSPGHCFLRLPAGPLDRAIPLSSRRGLLLACRIPLEDRPDGAQGYAVELVVYNLFAGTHDALPRLECNGFGRIACSALLTGADWEVERAERMLRLRREPCLGDRALISAVVCRGTAYWLFRDTSSYYTLAASVENGLHMSLTKLPISMSCDTYPAPRFSVGRGWTLKLPVLCSKSLELQIWTGRDEERQRWDAGTTKHWLCTRVIKLEPPRRMNTMGEVNMWLDEWSGMSLFRDMYIADLKTGVMEEVTDQFEGLCNGRVVPLEMDWPTFFKSRLGG